MAVASTLRGTAAAASSTTPPPLGRRRTLAALAQPLESLLVPAAKAYLLGYIMDVLPAILKALIRFVTTELKRIRASEKRLLEEHRLAKEASSSSSSSAAGLSEPQRRHRRRRRVLDGLKPILPSFYRLPTLLHAIANALWVALDPNGMAISCFLAMAGWRISETLVWWPIAKYYALKLSSSASSSSSSPEATLRSLSIARISATFVASSLSSAAAMMMLQHQSAAALAKKQAAAPPPAAGVPELLTTIDTTPGWIPKSLRPSNLGFLRRNGAAAAASSSAAAGRQRSQPRIASLAPAGHFLSRLTSLTVPGTPSWSGGSGGSPAIAVSPGATLQSLPEVEGDEAVTSAPPASPVESLALGQQQQQQQQIERKSKRKPPLGRPSPTIDLTLFALVRGMDTLVRALAAPTAARKSHLVSSSTSSHTWFRRLTLAAADQAEGLIFVVCCAQIMWSWFYHPERLPPTYVKWITNLATMDERLLLALRCIRSGQPLVWAYQGKNMTPQGVHLLGSLAEELGHPYQWGDPTRLPNTAAEAQRMMAEARASGGEEAFVLHGAAGPRGRGEMGGMPCELVHCGTGGANCYKNALYRWIRGWRMSMAIYFPVHLLPRLLFNPRGFLGSPLRNLLKALTGAARSAAFLATYIVGNWFPICLARSALLPRLFPSIPFNFWDAGIGPLIGSIACGFSIFLEEKRKRAEMALYVAPRALFAMVESAKPGWLSQGEQTALWAERMTFGMSVGVVVCAARYRPDLLRGITAAMGWVASAKGVKGRTNYARSAA